MAALLACADFAQRLLVNAARLLREEAKARNIQRVEALLVR